MKESHNLKTRGNPRTNGGEKEAHRMGEYTTSIIKSACQGTQRLHNSRENINHICYRDPHSLQKKQPGKHLEGWKENNEEDSRPHENRRRV